jgi:hypothetical protein
MWHKPTEDLGGNLAFAVITKTTTTVLLTSVELRLPYRG